MTDDVPWLTAEEQRAWRAFLRLQHQLTAHLTRHMQATNEISTPDFAVLVQLSEAPDGRARAFELGRELQWEKSRLSHQLSRMERRDLIRREGCPTDRRGAYVAITPRGRATLEQAAPAHVREVRRVFLDQLTPAEISLLSAMAERVLPHLDSAACADSD